MTATPAPSDKIAEAQHEYLGGVAEAAFRTLAGKEDTP